jgi:PAS domain S-box-containing protein
MQVANKLVGIINLNVTNRLRPFTLGQMKALTILASTAAAALESASLYTQVQQAEKNYRSIFENAVEGIFQSTPDGRFLTVNPALANILGYDSPKEVVACFTDIGKQLYVDPAFPAQVTQTLKERGVLQGFEVEAYRKDGENTWLSLNMRVIRDDRGAEVCREGTIEDITERKRAQDEIRKLSEELQQRVIERTAQLQAAKKTEQKFKDLLESAPEAALITNGDGAIVLVNSQAERLFGYSRAELLGQEIETLIPGRYRERHGSQRAGYLHDPKSRPMGGGVELSGLHKDGTEFLAEISIGPLETEEGTLVSVSIRDITERKRAEHDIRKLNKDLEEQIMEVRRAEERYRSIFDNAMEGI